MILFILWAIREIRAVFAVVALWQHKEYRWDRMRSHWSMPGTKRALLLPASKAVLLLALWQWDTYAAAVITGLYLAETILFIQEITQRRVQRPDATRNAVGLAGLSLFIVLAVGFSLFVATNNPLYLLGVDIATALVVSMLALAIRPLVLLSRRKAMRSAQLLRASFADVDVIGITGSYGKSGTKHLLAALLCPEGKSTIITPGNVNSEIGVTRFILQNLRQGVSRAVIEMGAYRMGEITRMAEIAQPSVGIITAVGNQHISLFGSRENIAKAKYELIDSLPKDGTAIFNADSPAALKLARATEHCRVLTYSVRDPNADYYAANISYSPDRTCAAVRTPLGTFSACVPMMGVHVWENALAAIAAAETVGISHEIIRERLRDTSQQSRTMERVSLSDGTLLIDDSYSSNPEGVTAAARTLGMFPDKRKVVVMQPMIELGEEIEQAHRTAGEELGKAADLILYAGTDYADAFQSGVAASAAKSEVRVASEEEILRVLDGLRGPETVVLLEGRIPRLVWEHLRKESATPRPHNAVRPVPAELAPNASAEDARRAFRFLFRPAAWRAGSAAKRLEEAFRKRLGAPTAIAITSGRHAIAYLLRASGIPSGSEVIIQAYTCVSVPASVLWAGHTPVYADIGKGTYTLDPDDLRRHITPHTKAIIIQHTFGIPARMDELLAIAREHNLVVIEDCAHTIGASFRGQEVGTFGDAAVFSFGRDKAISSTFGGMAVVHTLKRFPLLEKEETAVRKRAAAASWVIRQLLHPVLFVSIIRPLYFKFGIGKALLVLFQKVGLLSKAVVTAEKCGSPPPFPSAPLPDALASLALSQLDTIDGRNARRAAHAARYREALRHQRVHHPSIPEGADPALLRYPILIEGAESLRAKARSHGIQLGNWYDSPVAPGDTDTAAIGYRKGLCPEAEYASSQSLNLPTNPTLSDEQRETVISFMKNHI